MRELQDKRVQRPRITSWPIQRGEKGLLWKGDAYIVRAKNIVLVIPPIELQTLIWPR